jgi:hypothetical protein
MGRDRYRENIGKKYLGENVPDLTIARISAKWPDPHRRE